MRQPRRMFTGIGLLKLLFLLPVLCSCKHPLLHHHLLERPSDHHETQVVFQTKPIQETAIQIRGGKRTKSLVRNNNDVPVILRPLVQAYRALPTHGVAIASALVWTCLDYTIAAVFLDASDSTTRAVAGGLTTIVHSTLLCLGLMACLIRRCPRPSSHIDTQNTSDWWQDAGLALIQVCTGYMFYDAAVQFGADRWVSGKGLVLSATDWLFLGHHFAVVFYMVRSYRAESCGSSGNLIVPHI